MIWVIAAMVAVSSTLLVAGLLQLVLHSDKRMDKRVKKFLALNDGKKLNRKKFDLLVQVQVYKQAVREKALSKKRSERLAVLLQRAGVPLKPEEYVLFQWMSTALCAGVFYLIGGMWLLAVPGAVVGFMVPRWWVLRRQKKRLVAFNEGLSDLLTTIIGSLRAGFSFVQALKTVVDESEGPIREEADIVLREMQYGSSMEEALAEWRERVPSEDLDLMIQAILIQRQIGGNLAVILETIVQTIRDRAAIQRQVTTLTAQGRLSGLIIGALPFALGGLMGVLEPSYIGGLFHHPLGLMMMGAGLLSGSIGFFLIRKITTIEV